MMPFIQYIPAFLLVLCRITAFFVVAPIFSMRGIPNIFKIGFAFFVSLLTFISIESQAVYAWDAVLLANIFKEILVGMLLGFTAYMFFVITQIAGSFVDMQMGFGIANVIDPMTGMQAPILGNFKFFIAILLFLALDGHHLLILSIMQSYEWVPLDHAIFTKMFSGDVSNFLIDRFIEMFVLAFKMVAPLICALFLVDVGLGILAKTVPQMNIFVVGIPIKILVGFAILFIMIPGLIFLYKLLFESLVDALGELLSILSSGI